MSTEMKKYEGIQAEDKIIHRKFELKVITT